MIWMTCSDAPIQSKWIMLNRIVFVAFFNFCARIIALQTIYCCVCCFFQWTLIKCASLEGKSGCCQNGVWSLEFGLFGVFSKNSNYFCYYSLLNQFFYTNTNHNNHATRLCSHFCCSRCHFSWSFHTNIVLHVYIICLLPLLYTIHQNHIMINQHTNQ